MSDKNRTSLGFTMTNPIEDLMKDADTINNKDYHEDVKGFTEALTKEEMLIRQEERETLVQMKNIRIEGIII